MSKSNRLARALHDLLQRRRSVREYSAASPSRGALERILDCGHGRSGTDKRHAPSAHALYPLRLFAIVRRLDGVEPGLYHVDAQHARLAERLGAIAPGALYAASLADDVWLEEAAVVVVVAADYPLALSHFADQQPDGLRGARYVHIEAGTVVQNMHLATVAEGLGGVMVAGFDDTRLSATLALPEPLEPVALFCIGGLPDPLIGRR